MANGQLREAVTNCTIVLDDREYYGIISWKIVDVWPAEISIHTLHTMEKLHHYNKAEIEEELRITSDTPLPTEDSFLDQELPPGHDHQSHSSNSNNNKNNNNRDQKQTLDTTALGETRVIAEERLVLFHNGLSRTC